MKMSKQVKTNLSDEDYARFSKVLLRYGFGSAYMLVRACVNVCTAILSERLATPATRGGHHISGGGIAEAFASYSEYEEQPSAWAVSGGAYQAMTAKPQCSCDVRSLEATNKHYADTYITRNYDGLRRKYGGALNRGTSETSRDVLHDTLLGLYKLPVEVQTYEEFTAIANEKLKYNGE